MDYRLAQRTASLQKTLIRQVFDAAAPGAINLGLEQPAIDPHPSVMERLEKAARDGKADFISRLVALVPRPRVNLTRFHGVFAPNSKYRALVTPAKRGKSKKIITKEHRQNQTPAERRASMTWAQRLKRVFDIDVETCSECGGDLRARKYPLVILNVIMAVI